MKNEFNTITTTANNNTTNAHIEQTQLHGLIGAEHLAGADHENRVVRELTSCASDAHTHRRLLGGRRVVRLVFSLHNPRKGEQSPMLRGA